MASENKLPEYVLHRDAVSSIRLNLQHYIWTEEDGFLLHPSIAAEQPRRIADIGTGTGIWAIQVAKQFPNARVDGVDISLEQTPPKEWTPANVHFDRLDIFEEIPQEMVGVYDVVNLRLFYLVVRNQDPGTLIRKFMRMLKPGGWLQWAEIDPTTMRAVAVPGKSGEHLQAAMDFRASNHQDKRTVPQWITGLGGLIEKEGMQVVHTLGKELSDSIRAYYHDTALIVWESLRQGMGPEQGKKYKELLEEAGAERATAGRGVAMGVKRTTVIAKKPVEGPASL